MCAGLSECGLFSWFGTKQSLYWRLGVAQVFKTVTGSGAPFADMSSSRKFLVTRIRQILFICLRQIMITSQNEAVEIDCVSVWIL